MKLRLRRYLRRTVRGRSADLELPIDAEQALEAAEDLVAHERFADAVRLLTETNRRCRNAQVEKRIVDIRFDAIKKTDWRIERPPLPVKVEDLFSGERIPEVPRESLTVDRLRSGIMNH